MKADDKLTAIYQRVEARLNELDKMSAPEYSRLDPTTELKSLLKTIDELDKPSCDCEHGTLYGDDPRKALIDLCTSLGCGCRNDRGKRA